MKRSHFLGFGLQAFCTLLFTPTSILHADEGAFNFDSLTLKGYRPGMRADSVANDKNYRLHRESSATANGHDGQHIYDYTHTSGTYFLTVGVVECDSPQTIYFVDLQIQDAEIADFYSQVETMTNKVGRRPQLEPQSDGRIFAKWDFSSKGKQGEKVIQIAYSPDLFGSDSTPFYYRLSVQLVNNTIYQSYDRCREKKKKAAKDIFSP